jgi:CDP-diacylglycerol--serine O-phosphatidyltransferase
MGVALFVGSVFILRGRILYIVMPILFTAYLLYGFIRPRISRKMRREIEEDDENEEASEQPIDSP